MLQATIAHTRAVLFINRHAVICVHMTARRSELAYRSWQCRQLIVVEVLSRIQEPFLFVKLHAVICVHIAARHSELAYLRRQARHLIVAEAQLPQRR